MEATINRKKTEKMNHTLKKLLLNCARKVEHVQEGPTDRAVALRARKLLEHLTYIPRRGMGQPGIHKSCA